MPTNLFESDTYPVTLQVPLATEPASAPGLTSLFFQGAVNRFRWLFNRVNVFVVGGLVAPLGTLQIGTGTTHSVIVNGLQLASPADGGAAALTGGLAVTGAATVTNGVAISAGGLSVAGGIASTSAVSAPKQVVQGRTTTGTTNYLSSLTQVIYNNGSVASGVIWKISDTPALGPDGSGALIQVFNSNATAITVQDPAGTSLGTISSSSKRMLLYCNGTAWSVIDFS